MPLHFNATHFSAMLCLCPSVHCFAQRRNSFAFLIVDFPLPRRAIPCHSNASPLDTSPFPCRAGLFNAVPEPFKTVLYHCYPLLNYAFTSLGISFPPRCKPYLDDALPLRRVAKQRISFAMPCLTLLFLCLAKRGWALPLPYFSTLCCSFALLRYASPRKAFAALHVPKQNSAGPMQFLAVRRSASPLFLCCARRNPAELSFAFAHPIDAMPCHCEAHQITANPFHCPVRRAYQPAFSSGKKFASCIM